MFSKTMLPMLLEVISSWQVIAVTIAIVIYMSLVSYVARSHHRPRPSKSRPKKKKAEAAAGPEEVSAAGSDANDELGLEET